MKVGMGKSYRKRRNANLEKFKEATCVDYLSELPDALLAMILSILPLKEAVQTCILSSRWRFLWTYLPDLKFEWRCSTNFVNNLLANYKGPKVQKMFIAVEYTHGDISRVDSWFSFVVARHVEKLELVLNFPPFSIDYYKVPKCLFLCGSLVHLELEGCVFEAPSSTRMVALKSLRLLKCEVSENAILDFTSGCHVLCKLSLISCNEFSLLNIALRNPSVVDLEIDDFRMTSGLKINAPFLTSLKIKASCLKDKYLLENLSSLKKATLDLEELVDDEVPLDYYYDTVLEMISSLGDVRHLCLCRACLEIFSYYDEEPGTTPVIKSKYLEIKTELLKSELIGLGNLLKWCPDIENLGIGLSGFFISLSCDDLNFDNVVELHKFFMDDLIHESYYNMKIDDITCMDERATQENGIEDSIGLSESNLWTYIGNVCSSTSNSLKKVEIDGVFHGIIPKMVSKSNQIRASRFRMRQSELVRALLGNLTNLDAITIGLRKGSLSKNSRLAKKLRSFPMASKRAKMVFL